MDFPSLETPVIIAMKGLPYTSKTYVAASIAKWARSPILRIDDFLNKLYRQAGDNGDSSQPSMDEAERLYQHAFDILCEVASCQLLDYLTNFKCVVIKSRLCFTFELDRLIQLAGLKSNEPHPLIIIECQIRNEYLWRSFYYDDGEVYERMWYRPKTWNEVETARQDYDAQAWDSHFNQTIIRFPPQHQRLIRRLVVDISNPGLILNLSSRQPTQSFADAIKYLLTGDREELHKLPSVVDFHQLRQSLLEKVLNAPIERTKYLCTSELGCVFKYWEALDDYAKASCYCEACEEQVSGPSYACYFCNLIMHKSCAEMDNFCNDVPYSEFYEDKKYYRFPEKYVCNSCRDGGKDFSYECKTCIFQTHLKCRLMPTIVYHDCHPEHFLSIQLDSSLSGCKACNFTCDHNSYVCKICNYNYHLRCILIRPREIKHEHGGYEHLMKLVYSLDDKELEDFWCDICYEDMNREAWFYSCQECDYVIHPDHVDFPFY